jgi:hypothetical protein
MPLSGPDARVSTPDVRAADDEAVVGPDRAGAPGALGLLPDWPLEAITQSQNASLISLVTAIVAVASVLVARSTVTAGTTPAR